MDSEKIYPVYLKAYQDKSLQEKVQRLNQRLKNCDICPRNCRVDRLSNQTGFCKTGIRAKVYSYLKHHGEEPAISGSYGSGTIFFSNCNMRCVYCQNYEFSQEERGKEVSDEQISDFMLELQKEGCHNINFVTPTHVVPQILKALILAIEKGLKIPLVYNSSGYDSVEVLREIEGVFDIFLPDARYADGEVSFKYSRARDYPQVNRLALKEMRRQVSLTILDVQGVIHSGLIIRHLVLPSDLSGTEKIMEFISRELGQDTYISLMSQYFPCYNSAEYPELCRRISQEEYRQAIDIMARNGLHNGWIQEENGLDRFAGINLKANF